MLTAALLTALTLASTQPVNLPDESRLDFNCAASAAWMIAGQHETAKVSILPLYTFFLGRLSARDPHRDWLVDVAGATQRGDLTSDAMAELEVCGDIYARATQRR